MLRSGIWATKDDTSPDRLMRTGVEPENREYKAFADLKSCWQRVLMAAAPAGSGFAAATAVP